ncbi:hypothetical protein A0J61_02494 [Choanephora cucurbitarum]|uniref:Uncharacterized protein n=1 Tax=Choanephora cucurbitarum TaxID=101091 RepID=A0A1C7NLY0_9FUNG|nr:hypothetical protein A0J61_02494 [Choanephora cucurbitarum]
MTHNILRTSSVNTCSKGALKTTRLFSTKKTGWFQRFLSPAEEKKLYLGITSSFREKLVEQSNKSTQTYSHIIEHALLTSPLKPTTGMLSITRIEQIKLDLDLAGKQKDLHRLQQLQLELDNANLTAIAVYNRLIRAYLWCDELALAENVLSNLEARELVPTVRTFTYLIQAHLKRHQIDQAKALVKKMDHLSLLKLRTSFDCAIMLKFYQSCGDTHAIDYVWRDLMTHATLVKPGLGLFTQYMEYLLDRQYDVKSVDKTVHQLLTHLQQDTSSITEHQYAVWIKSVNYLASKDQSAFTATAEQLLFFLMKRLPAKISWETINSSIDYILQSYLSEQQDLKMLAFYYKLRKLNIPDESFQKATLQSIETVLQRVETQSGQKDTMAKLEHLCLA